MSLEKVLKDPRLVTMEHNGEDMHFWYHRRMFDIAANHGYNPDDEDEEGEDPNAVSGDSILRLLWMCHLTFEPELSFDDFDIMFLPSDYEKLGAAAFSVLRKQRGIGEVKESDDDAKPDEPVKKAKGRSKKK